MDIVGRDLDIVGREIDIIGSISSTIWVTFQVEVSFFTFTFTFHMDK
jgi:predicted acyltransferase (DUF342 family)